MLQHTQFKPSWFSFSSFHVVTHKNQKGVPVPRAAGKSASPWPPYLHHTEWRELRTLCAPHNTLTLFPSTTITVRPSESAMRPPYLISSGLIPNLCLPLLPWWLSGKKTHQPMQEIWVQYLIWEDPTCHRATQTRHHNYWACAFGLPGAQMVKSLPAMQMTLVWSLGWEDPLEKAMGTCSSILAWRTLWIEEPGGLQSMESQRVRHDWATNTLGFPDGSAGKESACNSGDTRDLGLILELEKSPGGGNGNPLQCSCLENPMGRGVWWATVHGATQSQTWLSD